jgi:hypothetical protein
MDMQTASDQTEFVCHTMQADGVNGGADSGREVRALWEERERRRVQFRLSLTQARSYLSQSAKTLSRCVPAEPQ